jgi:hypothetical protein
MAIGKTTCIALVFISCFGERLCLGQEATKNQSAAEVKPVDPAVTPYHAEFVLNELENGKKINTRHFSMDLTAGPRKEGMKIGAKVPVEVKQGELQYLDVGVNIECRLTERQNGLGLEVNADVSSMAARSTPPLIRQFQIDGSTVVLLGKPVMIASGEEADSNHEFQLEVTVTKLRQE